MGDTLIQKDLAETLKIIKKNGRDSFYNGVLTEKIINELKSMPIQKRQKISRNAPCTCGSGKKYKHCHGKVA